MTKKINKNANLPLDKNGRIIMPHDILRTPENTFGTFKIDKFCKNNEFAIESPGGYAIDYENETFFNTCEIVSNIETCPYFYEMLVNYFEE